MTTTSALQKAMEAVEAAIDRKENPVPPVPDLPSHITVRLPPGTEQYANDIRRFVDAMLYKLGKHQSKGRWSNATPMQVMALMAGEYRELHEAILNGNTIETILEAADVANYAMIVASIVMDTGHDAT